jgi:predicted TIM-barrel fold metal-dependent hydrolase
MDIIDTHLHVVDTKRLAYPWIDSVPALQRDFSLAEYRSQARRCGVVAALHMEVDVAQDDIERETEMVRDFMAEDDGFVLGAISACRPEDAGFPAFLERQLANPVVKGFRRVLHVMPDETSTTATFRDNVKRLSGTGRPFDLCMLPRQIGQAIALADHAPDVQFVLDHCGVPAIAAGDHAGWARGITEIARRPNVAVKISGISAYADPDKWVLEDLRPYVEHVLTVFGFDRAVWGGDWPVVTLGSSLPIWVAATQALVSGASEEERAKLFHGNARRIWSL